MGKLTVACLCGRQTMGGDDVDYYYTLGGGVVKSLLAPLQILTKYEFCFST